VGKEIVYCQGCGISLREDDFGRGKALTLENRPYCAACRPAAGESEAPPPAAAPSLEVRRETTARKRKTSTAHIPALGPASSKRVPAVRSERRAGFPLPLVVGGATGALLLVVLVAALASGGKRPARSPEETADSRPAPSRVEATPPARVEAPAPSRVEGAEPARRPPEERQPQELKPPTEQEKASRLDTFLAQIRELIAGDKAFQRRAEIQNMIAATRKDAGARAGEVDRLQAEYEKGFGETAERLAAFAVSEARRLAAQKRFEEASAKLDEYPPAFQGTRAGDAVRKLKEDLVGLQVEAALADRSGPPTATWGPWRVWSSREDGMPQILPAHAGRSNVYLTHPLDRQTPARLEREFAVPAGKRTSLSFWVAPHEKGDWELRAWVAGKAALQRAVGPANSGWKQVTMDLTPWAGKEVTVRLENAPTDWSWEHGYWADFALKAE
jgi:hypothetical protein